MIERVHPWILERAVGANAIPALPHRGSSPGERVQPRRIGPLSEQIERERRVSVTAEHVQEIRRAEETGGQMPIARAHILPKALGSNRH